MSKSLSGPNLIFSEIVPSLPSQRRAAVYALVKPNTGPLQAAGVKLCAVNGVSRLQDRVLFVQGISQQPASVIRPPLPIPDGTTTVMLMQLQVQLPTCLHQPRKPVRPWPSRPFPCTLATCTLIQYLLTPHSTSPGLVRPGSPEQILSSILSPNESVAIDSQLIHARFC